MPLLSPTVQFEHRIKWSIRDFHKCPSWNDLVITSPEFDVRLLDVVTLKFSLQTMGSETCTLFAVHQVGDVFTAQHPSLRVAMAIPAVSKQQLPANNPPRPRPAPPIIPGIVSCSILERVYPGMPLDGEPLDLFVSLKTTIEQGNFWSVMMDPHLVALSNDLAAMVTRPAYTNFVIESNQGVRFDIHSCMLRARMPTLYQQGDISMSDTGSSSDDSGRPVDRDVRVFDSDMPTETTRAMVFYLYGRIASAIPESQRVQLLNFAHKYELKDLENMLTLCPHEYSLGTGLVMDEMCINFPVAGMCVNSTSSKIWFPNVRIIKTAVAYTVFNDKHIEFAFSLDSYPQAPVNIKVSIVFKNASEQVLMEHLFWHTFTDKKTWTTPRFVALGLENVHLISCQVQMIGGRFDHKEAIANSRERDTGRRLIFNNTLTLSMDMNKLYMDQHGCDFELHIGSSMLKVHKAIVVARSPTIREMVTEKERKPVDRSVGMVELREEFLLGNYNDVVIYMYSGRIVPRGREHLDYLIDIADYLDMPFLVEHLVFLTK